MSYTITLPGKPHLYNPTPLPAPWEVVGEVQREGELTGGALVRNAATGLYAQANAGALRSLDQTAVARALLATVPGADLDGEAELTAAQAAELVGQTVQAIAYWQRRGYIAPIPGTSPARYRKSDIVAAKNREVKAGRPRKN